jgi:hypothetical protein
VDVDPFPAVAQFPFARDAEPRYTPTGASASVVRNPRDGLVTIIAYVAGEEFFDDNNANGTYDVGERFIDQGEPFVDANDNNQWDPSEVFIDTDNNGTYTPPNGKWDVNATIWTEARLLYTGTPAVINQPLDQALFPNLQASEWPQSFPNVAAVEPQFFVACPSGLPAGRGTALDAYFPDFQGNRVSAANTNLAAALVTSPGAVTNSNTSLLDAYGFGIQRRLVHAAFLPPAGSTVPAEPNPPEDDCTAATPACKWKVLFYNWDNGFTDRINIVAKASASDTAPCASNALRSTVTVLGNGLIKTSKSFGTP